MPWPPRLAFLTPLDFNFWNRMLELVYDTTPVENDVELVGIIIEAAAIIQENNGIQLVQ